MNPHHDQIPDCADLSDALQAVTVHHLRAGAITPAHDQLAAETPVALTFNGIAHITLLASPVDLDDLVLGFAFTEGLITAANQLYDMELEETRAGLIAHCQIASERMHALKQRRRMLAGRTGCGLCGVESLDQVHRPVTPLKHHGPYRWDAISKAVSGLGEYQILHRHSGATHAAAWADADGALRVVREDVGRHNALDKLIGHLLRCPEQHLAGGLCLVSSRASFEMVQKAAVAGLPALIALSAATHLAVTQANAANMLLAGFARPDHLTLYTGHTLIDPGLLPCRGNEHNPGSSR